MASFWSAQVYWLKPIADKHVQNKQSTSNTVGLNLLSVNIKVSTTAKAYRQYVWSFNPTQWNV